MQSARSKTPTANKELKSNVGGMRRRYAHIPDIVETPYTRYSCNQFTGEAKSCLLGGAFKGFKIAHFARGNFIESRRFTNPSGRTTDQAEMVYYAVPACVKATPDILSGAGMRA